MRSLRITSSVVVFFLISIATILVILRFSAIITEVLHKVFSTSLSIHLLFNFLIIVIVSKEHYRTSSNEFNLFSTDCFSHEEHETSCSNDECNLYADDLECGRDQSDSDQYDSDSDSDGNNSSDEDYYGSDGYDEDDDDDGSYGEIWWDEDEEEHDSELERKIEAFITKVINGWKEEWFSDNMQT